MKKVISIIYVLLNVIVGSYAQGLDNLWLLGYGGFAGPPYGNINMDFISGTPNIYNYYRPMYFSETNAEICNKQGNLLFYTNGVYIANVLDDTMQNGSGINPSLYTSQNQVHGLHLGQGNLVIPFIDDTNKYYLFHETAYYQTNTFTYQPHELYYSIIDMSLDSGKGAVLSKNNILISDTLIFGELTSVKHANGRDWWLIFHRAYSQLFYKSLITPAGISPPDTQTIANMYYAGGAGQCAFSPDGNWYARYQNYDDLTIMQFDRCSGMFSNPTFIAINDSATASGIAFSPDSKKVYASSRRYIYQYLLDSANLAATQTTVAVWDSFYSPFATTFYLAALAHDDKIYLNSTNGVQYLHVIDQPNQIGVSCNVIQHGVLLPSYNAYTIPNFPNYFLGPVLGSVCDSLGLGVDDNIYFKNLNLRINPNPAQNSFYLNYELPTGKNAILYVYSTLGKMVYKQRLFSVNKYLLVHCNAWQQGMYYLKVVMDKNEFSADAKVVIIH